MGRLIPASWLDWSQGLLGDLECLLHERLKVDSLGRDTTIDRMVGSDQRAERRQEVGLGSSTRIWQAMNFMTQGESQAGALWYA
jgi:hypothetical protein